MKLDDTHWYRSKNCRFLVLFWTIHGRHSSRKSPRNLSIVIIDWWRIILTTYIIIHANRKWQDDFPQNSASSVNCALCCSFCVRVIFSKSLSAAFNLSNQWCACRPSCRGFTQWTCKTTVVGSTKHREELPWSSSFRRRWAFTGVLTKRFRGKDMMY